MLSNNDKKYLDYFIKFMVVLIIFFVGVYVGKSYVINYQTIHKTDKGFCVELDNKEWEYNNG